MSRKGWRAVAAFGFSMSAVGALVTVLNVSQGDAWLWPAIGTGQFFMGGLGALERSRAAVA